MRANTIGTQITALKAEQRVLALAATAAAALVSFDSEAYNEALTKRAQLATDYETLRRELFAAADLPAEPDDTWSDFIEAGETYRQHLVELGAHDSERCLYCRQPLLDPARDLLSRYATYLEDGISADIRATDSVLAGFKHEVASVEGKDLAQFVDEFDDEEEQPSYFAQISAIEEARSGLASALADGKHASVTIADTVTQPKADVDTELIAAGEGLTTLETQQQNRAQALAEKQTELVELKDAAELGKSWPLVEAQVRRAKEADQLKTLKRPLPSLVRVVTALAKTASDQLTSVFHESVTPVP